MAGPKKPSAASRTVDMFAQPPPMDARPIEVVEGEQHERVPLEDDVDNLRAEAFKVQAWSTAAFGSPEAAGNEYRVSFKDPHYYVETLAKTPGTRGAYGYVGLMVHERDLLNLTKVLVQAVRDKQNKDNLNAK